jgi:hypothetical protein
VIGLGFDSPIRTHLERVIFSYLDDMNHDALFNSIDNFVALAEKVYGPYTRQDGRQIVIIKNDDGSYRTTPYARHLLEQHLDRQLHPDEETVDHIDSNKDNNNIENLRIVPRKEHSGDDTRRVKLVSFDCSMCGKNFERSPRLVRDKSKKGRGGPFCSRQCAGRYARKVQLKLLDRMPAQPFIQSEYYKRKNVVASYADHLICKYGLLIL